MIDLDFSDVSRDGGGTLLTEGQHVLTISDVELKPAKSTDKYPTIWVKYECDGSHVRDFINLHPNALWKVRIWLEAVTGMEFDGPIQFDEKEFIGKQVLATVTVGPRNDGKGDQNNIVAYEELPF